MHEDQIILTGMEFYGYHGVNPEEKQIGQKYLVDLAISVDLRKPGESDLVNDTISYTDLYKTAKHIMEGDSHDLIESLAQCIAKNILITFPVESVSVSVAKPHPPIKNSLITHAAVTIHRDKTDVTE
ncbi:MAG: dihydroneopterin aldolase [Chloroflexota bacterium]|nr:dihydroneopterin aldolase [Chloroflexota bacterium]